MIQSNDIARASAVELKSCCVAVVRCGRDDAITNNTVIGRTVELECTVISPLCLTVDGIKTDLTK